MKNNVQWHNETKVIHSPQQRTHEMEHTEIIYTNSSFVFENCAQGEARMAQGNPGNVYSRYTNPTVREFERRIAELEQTDDAVATASGMSAIQSCLMTFLQTGDHIICAADVFGSTIMLMNNFFVKMGVEVTYIPLIAEEQWQQSIKINTKLLFLESPSNPLNTVADIRKLSKLAKQHNALLIVDNCLCTPILQTPFVLGADLVLHSATKYLDGQGRMLGGVVCGNQQHIDQLRSFIRSAGPCMSSFNAWVFLKSLETLHIRMNMHSQNGMAIAQFLQRHLQVKQVYYAGLVEHPQHHLARQQQKDFGGVLSFTVSGGRQQAWTFIDAMQMMSITPNFGDTKTMIIHPATTTHGRLTEVERQRVGIGENLIRLSIGLEHVDDIISDLKLGFNALLSQEESSQK